MSPVGWHDLADVSDLADRDVIGREAGGRSIAIYRVDGAYYATGNICTHAHARLCEGEVVDGFIECPAHHGYFEITTGRAQGAPVSVDLATYPVRVVRSRIEVALDEAR